jgi:glutaredoxin
VSGPARRPEVVFYTRAGCGLCRRAEDLVAREARGADITHVDVDTAEDLIVKFGVRVPVVTVDDVEVAELEVAPGTVRKAVRVARRARRRQALGPSSSPP